MPSVAKQFFEKTREVLKTATSEDTLGVPAFMHVTAPGPLVTPPASGHSTRSTRTARAATAASAGSVSGGRGRRRAAARARRPRRRDAARAEGSPHA